MTRFVGALAALLILGAGLAAQAVPAAAPEAYKRLAAEFDAASKKYVAEVRALAKTPEYQALVKERDRAGMMKLRSTVPDPTPGFVTRFQAEAARLGDQGDAAWFHAWLAVHARDQKTKKASVALLRDSYIASPAMEMVAKGLFSLMRGIGKEDCLELAGEIAADNPNPMAKAYALFSRATILRRDRNATAAQKEQAAADLRAVEKLAPGSTIALRAAGPRFARERLQIGMVAPDIVGKDLNGEEMKLSDYRGKVVVLDFWGDW